MNEGFYKTSRAMLGRTDLTPAEKLVRIVRAHWQAFEGRRPTVRELAVATGLSERGIRKILGRLWTARAKQLTEQSAEQSAARSSGKAERSSAPSCSKSLSSVRDVDKGERHATPPSPSAAQGGKKEKTDGIAGVVAKAAEDGGMLAMLALKGRAGGGKWPLARWIGQVEEDTAARRYTRADLEAFVAHRTSITEAPWKLASAVGRHAAAAKATAFRERLRTIRAEGLSDARFEGDRRRWRVRYVDEGDGLLILEEVLPEPAPPALEELERQLRQCERRRWPTEPLSERIEAIRAGRPDPRPESRGEPEKKEIRTPDDMRGWTFRPYQPRLFD